MTPEVPATDIPATMTDGRADLTASTDSFLPGLLPAGPDVPARPAVGHPLFTCRFLTSEIPGARPPSPGAEPANVEEVLQAFEDELARFESLPENQTDEATESLDQLECLALQLEALPTDGLESQALRNRHIAILRSWSVVRTATVRLSERLDHAPDVMVNDTGSSDRMRAAADRLVEVVYENSDPEDVDGLETRLDAAIDDDDVEFLIGLTPEAVENFLTAHQLARALFDFAEQDTSEDRLTGYLESARTFASLGLNGCASDVLEAAERGLENLPETAFLDGLFAIARVYQGAGMIDDANGSLLRLSFVGENSTDPECRERGTLAHAMQLLNRGEFGEAEAMLDGLPDSELRQALLDGIHEGQRRARVLENSRLLQGYLVLYSETHEFADSTPEEIRTELLGGLRVAMETALSGENPDLMAAFTATDDDFPAVAGFVFDGPYTDTLRPLMNPDLDNNEYAHRILMLADGYMSDGDYTSASIVADAIADDPELGEDAAVYRERIEYHTARESLSRTGVNLVGDFLSVVPLRIVTGIVTGVANAVYNTASFFTLGALGGTMEDNIIGTGELALIIASEGLSVEAEALFVGPRFAAGLSESALTWRSLAVRSGTMATAMAPGTLLLNAARERSLAGLTWTNLGREFGANLVLFGLMHGTGRFVEGASAPVRWGVGVGSFVAADYTNEFLNFHDPSEAGFEARLESSILGDFNVRFATWVGGRISGGHYERVARETAIRRGELIEAARRRSAAEGVADSTFWADLRSAARGVVSAPMWIFMATSTPGGTGVFSGGRRSGGPFSWSIPSSYREAAQRLSYFSERYGHEALMTDFAGGPYVRTPVAEAILNNPNLRPRTSVRVGDRTFYLGPIIRTVGPDGPRSYSLGVVPILEGGAVRLREVIFYRSNSDGGWRVTPARMGDVLLKGRFRMGDEGRGHYTQETQLAPEISGRLEALEGEPTVSMPEASLNDLINIMSPLNEGRHVSMLGRFGDQQRLSLAPGLEAAQRFAPGREMIWRDGTRPAEMSDREWAFITGTSPSISDLGSMSLPEGFVPNFSTEPVRTYTGTHTTLGETTFREYRGTLNGREVTWTMAEAEGDRVWIQTIRYAEAQVTDFGTYDVAIDTGILTSKPVEHDIYLGNLPESYRRPILDAEGNPTHYEDITPLLAELEPIRLFREARASREGTVADAVVASPVVSVGEPEVIDTVIPGPASDITSLIGTGGELPLPSISPEPSLPPPGREERGTVREPVAGRAASEPEGNPTARPPRRGGRVAEPVRPIVGRYMDLPAAFRSFIDALMIRASAAARRVETAPGGSLWSRDSVFTRRVEDGTLVIAPTSEVARAEFLEHLRAPGGPAVEDLGSGRYRVTVDGQPYELRVRLDGAALRSVVDGLIAEGMNQAEIESRLAEEGLTTREAAEVIGPRFSGSVREGRSGEGSL